MADIQRPPASILGDMAKSLGPPAGFANASPNEGGGADAVASNMPTDATAAFQANNPLSDPQAASQAGGLGIDTSYLDQDKALIGNEIGQLKKGGADAQARLDATGANAKQAELGLADVTAKKNQDMQPYFDDTLTRFNQLDKTVQELSAQTQARTEAQMAKWDAARSDAANSQIQDFFADKTVAGQAIGIISAAFGGFANGLSGNPGAPTALDRVIQRDMERQIQNLNQKNRVAAGEEGKLKLLMDQGLNQLQAVAALRSAAYDRLKFITSDIANKWGGAEAAAKAQQINAQFDLSIAKIQNDVQQTTSQSVLSGLKDISSLDLQRTLLMKSIAVAGMKMNQADGLSQVVEGFKGDKTQRENLSNMVQAYQNFQDSSAEENSSWDPFDNAKLRPDLGNSVATIEAHGAKANARQLMRGDKAVGGFITDTQASREKVGARLRKELLNVIKAGGGRPIGDLANTLDLSAQK